MVPSRVLTKLVTTTGSISAGAVLTLEGQTSTSKQGLELVPDLLDLVAGSICVATHPDEETRARVTRYLVRLIRRYGTMRRALDALAGRRRRHRCISVEKSAAWSQVMGVTPSLVGTTLRRHTTLRMTLTRWLSERGDGVEDRLDAYMAWLDAELPDFDDGAELRAESAHMSRVESATTPPAQEEAEPGTPAEESADLRLVRSGLLESKSFADPHNVIVHQTFDQREAIDRLTRSENAYERTVAAIARGDFDTADAFLPHLESQVGEAEFETLYGDRYYFEGRFDDALSHYRGARHARPDAVSRLNLALALLRCQRGKREEHCQEALDILCALRKEEAPDTPGWARAQSLIGSAWLHMPTGDRDANIRRAIECFEDALGIVTRESDPNWWAEAHLHLGGAWMALPSGKRLENIQRAITCFNRAGEVWTREADPERWATVQNNLGHAWERLPSGHRGVNLQRAIDYFNAALSVRDREKDPMSWATIQNNLGNAWIQLPVGDARENIARAIECQTAALQIWSASDRRAEWAATQNNLGNAWALMPAEGEERARNLRRSIACYRAALDVRTRAASPMEWAATQNNLGNALLMLEPGPGGKNVREAIECFNSAMEVRTRDVFPLDWAKTQANLAHAWSKLPEGNRRENLQNAIRHYQNAVKLLSAEAYPHQHAHIDGKLREVREELASLGS